VALLLYLAGALQAQGGVGLRGFEAEYRLSWHDMEFGKVEVSLDLRPDGGYRYRAHTIPLGLLATLREDEVEEISEGRIDGPRVVPHLYSYLHTRPEGDRDIRLEFDWAGSRVINRINGDSWAMALPAGALDKFGKDLAVMLGLLEGERRSLEFDIADGGKLKHYHYRVVGEESVELPIGVRPAVVLTRAKGSKAPNMRLWLGSDLNFLPLRVEKDDDGDNFLMHLQALRWHE